LQEQIQIISPKLLIAAGRLPMLYFLNFKGTMEQHRGWHESLIGSSSFKTFLTFNPASALYGERSEIRQKKLLIYQDWKEIGTYYRTL
jgi:uracil-DNA glycosylase